MCYPSIAPANISKYLYSDVTVVLISGIVGIVNFQMRGCNGCLCLPRRVPKATYDCGSDTWHVLQPSHSHLCGYEDFSNASVLVVCNGNRIPWRQDGSIKA